ncbi:uncharacterized protein L969DRAFT_89740 [Mixia osmundae IAM 14324]|uniref:RRM domain-containing protein n=1 Tax=Mixia osmundae (strain CBS 9802 / IAM 14324 / JCM 22182 / KY 12970) TaxID=764103 RepID=G7E4Z8_MIXOS|nr:uncharacterized protein L969DRAFT_89740 [Mixia osmundae IAM 14324]KEI37769.1 hypothetical protein L969DRAFT_89740 [Mixia osmundae IAM 14324]GAA97908.1 hypothetical protein E5Q_04588 [Mixia osmundae IAM 14324]
MAGNRTIHVGGFPLETDAQTLLTTFSTFGDIVDIQLPPDPSKPEQHRGFGFVEFREANDALDAMDNMHQNEMLGRTIKVTLAKPSKGQQNLGSNRAIWEDEAWLKDNAKPLA